MRVIATKQILKNEAVFWGQPPAYSPSILPEWENFRCIFLDRLLIISTINCVNAILNMVIRPAHGCPRSNGQVSS
jgi:hypothetical protein